MDLVFFAYPLLGLLSGVLAGMLGIGGGLLIVPALLLILPFDGIAMDTAMHAAVATSLATVIMTASMASYLHHRRGAVLWPIVARMTLGLCLGAGAGALLADSLSGEILRRCYGVFALAVALHMLHRRRISNNRALPGMAGLAGTGTFIGAVSSLVGIGGGTMTVPFLRWCGVSLQQAVATSSACGLPIALAGSISFMLLDQGGTGFMLGYIHGPAALGIGVVSIVSTPLGVALAHRVSTLVLGRIFSIFLIMIASYLLMG